MSVEVMGRVWKDPQLTSRTDVLIMLALADWANDEGECWPSIESIAKKTRCTDRAVQKRVYALERLQKLAICKNQGRANTNHYKLFPGVNAVHPESRCIKGERTEPKKDSVGSPEPLLTVRNRQEKEPTPTPSNGNPVWTATEIQLRLGKLFHRRPSTRWDAKEIKAFRSIQPIDEDDMNIIEAYYRERIPSESDFRRRDLQTLLNNWRSEVDRALGRKNRPRDYNL